ncbi:MAG: hypothetical protein IT455_03320 [Planctomycetes bacterium]|nr:hypothetical protein [Planctomycetota bacterium]
MNKPHSKRARRSSPLVIAAVAAPILIGLYYGLMWWRGVAAASEQRRQVVAEATEALAAEVPDENVLSRLMAALDKLPDADSAADLRAIAARIELVRGRPERADARFGAVAASPAATAADQRLGALILLRRAERESAEAAVHSGWLRQVAAYAQRAYDDGREPADLLMVWLARERLGEHAAATAVAATLQAAHADSAAAQLAALATAFRSEDGVRPIDQVARQFPVPPPEIEAMRVVVALQQRDLAGALSRAETLLLQAPGVFAVRQSAALVFHAAVLASAEGAAERAGYVERRDAQLDWLAARAPADEPQRQVWDGWRRQR